MNVFDIPPDLLRKLGADDFRELVARLCEAEIERQGGHRLEVRWGGRLTANDGGLDVVVEAKRDYFIPPHPRLPCGDTGVQVKLEDLAKTAIDKEMRPQKVLRPSISTLAAKNGAYLIISAGADCTEKMHQDRLKAMNEAVAGDPNAADIHLDFVDCNAVARWVSKHPSVAAWLRERMSLPKLNGWKPYGQWSATPAGEEDTLICKEGLWFDFGPEGTQPTTDLVKAIDAIRELVKAGDAAVRIVGLSGIGKTRLVQALFEQVGNTPELPPSHALYADVGQSHTTSPMQMLEALLQLGEPVVLVADNCPPETHQELARRLAEVRSKVRLVTVEYDVRTDQAEETDVVEIKAVGSDIVESLLWRRWPDLSYSDAKRLAVLAQGNARLGLALAQAAPKTGSLSTFDNAVLFDRLFWQRNTPDPALKESAEVLSLVYSFEVEGDENPDELTVLGSLIEKPRKKLRRHTATLLNRDLAQDRGKWCAILPHALANRLARDALENIHWQEVADTFADKPRLRQSFARRLSYLHNVKEAQKIVRYWMKPGGPLEDPTADMKLVRSVSHLVSDDLLGFVEKRIKTGDQPDQRLPQIDDLISITELAAHDENLFSRACHTLMNLALRPNPMRELLGEDLASEAIDNLFGVFSSETSAQTAVRISVAKRALNSRQQRVVDLGIKMLSSALEVNKVKVRTVNFDEDAQPSARRRELRDEEIVDWFGAWIRLAVDVANSDNQAAERESRTALVNRMFGIWHSVSPLRNLLIETIRELNARRPWPEASRRLNQILHYVQKTGGDYPEEDINAVEGLFREMSISDLSVRVYRELVGDVSDDRRVERLKKLGHELAANPDVLRSVMPEVLRGEGYRLRPLGEGIAGATDDPTATWAILRDVYLNQPDSIPGFLGAYLQHLDKINPKAAELIRQECRKNDQLRCDYGFFLPEGILSPEEIERVIEYAADLVVHAEQLVDIVWREGRGLSDGARIRLMRSLLSRSEGPELIVKSLVMLRQCDETGERQVWSANIREIGLDALEKLISGKRVDSTLDHGMGDITRYCLEEDDGSGTERLLTALAGHAARQDDSIRDLDNTASAIAEIAPEAYLNAVAPDPDAGLRGFGLSDARFGFWPLSAIPPESLVDWCSENDTRWTRIAAYLELFIPDQSAGEENNNEEKLSPQIVAILEAAPERDAVVDVLVEHITEIGIYSGSSEPIVERRLRILEQQKDHPCPEV